ncbi:hypothetical protein BDQ17DRAFT_1342610, partial [Cyathus striatus]
MCVVVFVFVVVALFSLLFLHTLLTFLHSFPTSHLLIYLLPSWFRFFWCTKRCWRTASLPFCFPPVSCIKHHRLYIRRAVHAI